MMEVPASAYTNPGAGLLIWQLGVAMFVGMLYQARKLFRRRK